MQRTGKTCTGPDLQVDVSGFHSVEVEKLAFKFFEVL